MTRIVIAIAAAACLASCAARQPAETAGPTAGAAGQTAGAADTTTAAGPGQTAGAADPTAGAADTTAAGPGQAAGATDESGDTAAGRRPTGPVHRFKKNRTGKRGLDRGVKASAIEPTRTKAALKFTLVDRDKGPIQGIVIKLVDSGGQIYYTEESDAKGYAEVLVPVGREYKLIYLSLGRRRIAAKLPVSDEPRQTIRLTLRYKRHPPPARGRGLVLEGVHFDSGKATLRQESFNKLDRVAEYLKHKRSARIEISGHTDNVGDPRRNKALSRRRAEACRRYLVSKGIDAGRIEAVGHGEEQPIASNDSAEGRQLNRRIEATEL